MEPILEFTKLFQAQPFVPVNDSLIKHYGLPIASYLCGLIDFAKDKDEWFLLPVQKQTTIFNQGLVRTKAYKKQLTQENIIQVKQISGVEYIRINFEELNKLLRNGTN